MSGDRAESPLIPIQVSFVFSILVWRAATLAVLKLNRRNSMFYVVICVKITRVEKSPKVAKPESSSFGKGIGIGVVKRLAYWAFVYGVKLVAGFFGFLL